MPSTCPSHVNHPTLRLWPLLLIVLLSGCCPNLRFRETSFTWNSTTRTVTAEVINNGSRVSPEFDVLFDTLEEPVSTNHPSIKKLALTNLPPRGAMTFTADFQPLSGPGNASLSRVKGFRITVDHKRTVRECSEFDNVIELLLPDCQPAASNVSTGTNGQWMNSQSFNETRAVRLQLAEPAARTLTRMTLEGLNVYVSGARVGARVYDDESMALVAGAEIPIGQGPNLAVSIPVNVPLDPSRIYRIGFYVGTPNMSGASGNFIWPAGANLVSPATYLDGSGVFRILSSHSIASDSFPVHPNVFVVQMTLETECASAAAPGAN